jgi:hypothetical protein
MTLIIVTLAIMTFSITIKDVTLSIMTHDAFAEWDYADCHYADCCGVKNTTSRYGYRLPIRKLSQAIATPVSQVRMVIKADYWPSFGIVSLG